MRHGDHLIAQIEREEQLGGVGDEADDAHDREGSHGRLAERIDALWFACYRPRPVLDELATGRLTAVEAVDRALARIERGRPGRVARARRRPTPRRAHEIDALRASGEHGRCSARRWR